MMMTEDHVQDIRSDMPGEGQLEESYSSVACDSLTHFTRAMFASLPRADQRRWAEVYLRGILGVRGRKSIRNMAEAILADASATQSLQQFVNQSPWDWGPVRACLAADADRLVRPAAWVVEQSVIPKRGAHSVGVEPRFVPHLGKTVNSQLGVSIVAAGDLACLPLNWRLHLSNGWLDDQEKRVRTRIPYHVEARSETELALEMIDELTADWGISPVPPVVAGAKPDDALFLAENLQRRGRSFLIQVEGDVTSLLGRPPLAARAVRSLTVVHRDLTRRPDRTRRDRQQRSLVVVGATPETARQPHLRQVTTAAPRSPEPGRRRGPDDGTVRLIREQTSGRRTGSSWISNLPAAAIGDITAITRLRHRSTYAMRQLGDRFGVRDFEGRSFPGWHHHLTLVSAAALYAKLAGLARESA